MSIYKVKGKKKSHIQLLEECGGVRLFSFSLLLLQKIRAPDTKCFLLKHTTYSP